jgi:hypothetical protein
MAVEMRLSKDRAARVTELDIAREWAGTQGASAVSKITVRDAQGDVPTQDPITVGPDMRIVFRRPPVGDLSITYRVRAAERGESRFALRIGRDRISGVGHSFLLLPRFEAELPVRLRWHLSQMVPGSVGACSLGSGDEITTKATSEDIAHAVYVAGKLDFIDGGGGRWMAILDAKNFEPSSTFLWTSKTLSLIQQRLDPRPDPEPFSFFLVAEPGLGEDHDGAALGRSFGLWFDSSRKFDERLELAVAHELLHRIFGTAVRLQDAKGREADWFSEGFTVHFARKLLFATKRISPEAFLDDLKRSTIDAGDAAPGDAWARPSAERSRAGYGRGSLYAATVDLAISRASKGARSLDDVVRELVQRARRERASAMPETALRTLLVRELGAPGGEEFDRVILQGAAPARLPSDAFGPCFRRSEKPVKQFELGYDRVSLENLPAHVRGVVKGSAAERAGLRDGHWVIAAKLPKPDAKPLKNVELTVSDRKGPRRIRYKPETQKPEVHWRTAPCGR